MKISKSRLKQLIKEEIEAMKSSEGGSENGYDRTRIGVFVSKQRKVRR